MSTPLSLIATAKIEQQRGVEVAIAAVIIVSLVRLATRVKERHS